MEPQLLISNAGANIRAGSEARVSQTRCEGGIKTIAVARADGSRLNPFKSDETPRSEIGLVSARRPERAHTHTHTGILNMPNWTTYKEGTIHMLAARE